MQTAIGALKARATMRRKYGTTKDGKSKFHVEMGREGGRNGHTSGFYGNPDRARQAGRIGGSISKRGVYLTAEQKKHARLALSIDVFLDKVDKEKSKWAYKMEKQL